jgi:LmbE family N-acetylglucosaminyl deacetylase
VKGLEIARRGERLSVLCLGAHSDDIEIGAGGTILTWIASGALVDVRWCVLSAAGERETEARGSAAGFLKGAVSAEVEIGGFTDGFFPAERSDIKNWFEGLKRRTNPDVILTHARSDAHQDHRLVCELAWNTFRDHLILEYEIAKWDGDVTQPNFYVPIADVILARKIALLDQHFGTQRSKAWFDDETFRGLARIRGVECRARYAEAFTARKVSLSESLQGPAGALKEIEEKIARSMPRARRLDPLKAGAGPGK